MPDSSASVPVLMSTYPVQTLPLPAPVMVAQFRSPPVVPVLGPNYGSVYFDQQILARGFNSGTTGNASGNKVSMSVLGFLGIKGVIDTSAQNNNGGDLQIKGSETSFLRLGVASTLPASPPLPDTVLTAANGTAASASLFKSGNVSINVPSTVEIFGNVNT